MANVKPFRAISYNQEKIKDLSRVACPPYDVISSSKQQYYYGLSPHNFIHILLGRDIGGEDKYERSAGYFRDWLKNKILIQDDNPGIYFYEQQYNIRGERKSRLGFIALLSLEEKKSAVFAHEHTCPGPKEDRLKLLNAVRANLSPIFVLFPDPRRIIQRIWRQHLQGKNPFIDIIDDEKTAHKLWKLDSPEALDKIRANLQDTNVFIADGHHRYEVACAWRDEMKKKSDKKTAEEDFNYILTYFTNIESHGLTILPIHRLIRLGAALDTRNFIAGLQDYFEVKEVKDKTQLFFLMEKGSQAEHILGMYKDKKYRLLRLKNAKVLDKMVGDKPKEYRELDVSVLNYIILKKILGIELEDKESLTFNPHADELIRQVDDNPLYIAFFLNPVKIGQMMSVALLGEKMPAKSTYFYPKVLSGLVINKLE